MTIAVDIIRRGKICRNQLPTQYRALDRMNTKINKIKKGYGLGLEGTIGALIFGGFFFGLCYTITFGIGAHLPGNEYVFVDYEDYVEDIMGNVIIAGDTLKPILVEDTDDKYAVYTKLNWVRKHHFISTIILIIIIIIIWIVITVFKGEKE